MSSRTPALQIKKRVGTFLQTYYFKACALYRTALRTGPTVLSTAILSTTVQWITGSWREKSWTLKRFSQRKNTCSCSVLCSAVSAILVYSLQQKKSSPHCCTSKSSTTESQVQAFDRSLTRIANWLLYIVYTTAHDITNGPLKSHHFMTKHIFKKRLMAAMYISTSLRIRPMKCSCSDATLR